MNGLRLPGTGRGETVKKLMVGAILLILALGAAASGVLFFSASAQDALLRRAAEARVIRARSFLYDHDSLDLVFCGTGSPIADPDRGAACIGIFAGGFFFWSTADRAPRRGLAGSRSPRAVSQACSTPITIPITSEVWGKSF